MRLPQWSGIRDDGFYAIKADYYRGDGEAAVWFEYAIESNLHRISEFVSVFAGFISSWPVAPGCYSIALEKTLRFWWETQRPGAYRPNILFIPADTGYQENPRGTA